MGVVYRPYVIVDCGWLFRLQPDQKNKLSVAGVIVLLKILGTA